MTGFASVLKARQLCSQLLQLYLLVDLNDTYEVHACALRTGYFLTSYWLHSKSMFVGIVSICRITSDIHTIEMWAIG